MVQNRDGVEEKSTIEAKKIKKKCYSFRTFCSFSVEIQSGRKQSWQAHTLKCD